jgi:hypothetical protein
MFFLSDFIQDACFYSFLPNHILNLVSSPFKPGLAQWNKTIGSFPLLP